MRVYRRAVGLVFDKAERIMMVRERGDAYWILPGGKPEEGETFLDACVRELREELGLVVAAGSLAFVFENFFVLDGTDQHEICVGFTVGPSVDSVVSQEIGVDRECRFFHPGELGGIEVMPPILRELLSCRTASPRYHVQRSPRDRG